MISVLLHHVRFWVVVSMSSSPSQSREHQSSAAERVDGSRASVTGSESVRTCEGVAVPLMPDLPPNTLPMGKELLERSAEELAVLSQRENIAAYAELVKRFEDRLFNFLLRRIGNRAAAEDLTQDAFIRAWERIKSYDPTWRFSTWLFTIAARLAVSEQRRTKYYGVIENERLADTSQQDPAAGPLSHRDDPCGGAQLWRLAAEHLCDDHHTALWLRYAEDMSIGEIAQVMGRSQVGVRVTLFRARQLLAAAAGGKQLLIDPQALSSVPSAAESNAGRAGRSRKQAVKADEGADLNCPQGGDS